MNGAESLADAVIASGVTVCFCNPGTTEMTLVAAFAARPEMRLVLGLHESVIAAAADGYARMTRTPALVLAHQGPGFANAIANLHNARRACSPVVVLVGAQPRWHEPFDSPLSCDITSLAVPVSGWVRTAASAHDLSRDVTRAIAAALTPPGQVATLVIPADCQWDPGRACEPIARAESSRPPDAATVARAVAHLSGGGRTALLVGGAALDEVPLRLAADIAATSACELLVEAFPARLACGQGLPSLTRVPYMAEAASDVFDGIDRVLLCGAKRPVSFFGYQDSPRDLIPAHVHVEETVAPDADVVVTLTEILERLGPRPPASAPRAAQSAGVPTGRLTPRSVAATVAALLPNESIVIDEAMSAALNHLRYAASAAPHSYLTLTGGACGMALGCAVGAAVASPRRRVITIVGDGSAMYAVQALWTQAREGLDVVTLVCANRAYRILQMEYLHVLGEEVPPRAANLFGLTRPPLDWVSLARGLGVRAKRVETIAALVDALQAGFAASGPSLVEVAL